MSATVDHPAAAPRFTPHTQGPNDSNGCAACRGGQPSWSMQAILDRNTGLCLLCWWAYVLPRAAGDALIAVAPEMEALLRDYLALTAAVFGHQESHDGAEVCLHCTNVDILKRLDAARKAGG